MASKREIDSLKTDLKDSPSKSVKRTPKKTKLLDQSTETVGRKSRSRSRSRTPTRKGVSRTVTPRVKTSTKKSAKEVPKTSKIKSPKTPKSGPSKRKSTDTNDSGSAHKKARSSPARPVGRPTGSRRSTRLAQTPRSEAKARTTRNVNFEDRSSPSTPVDNQRKGWLSSCSLM